MVIPQIDVPALRALRLVGAKTGGYHHRQRMCQPSGLEGLGVFSQFRWLTHTGRDVPPSGLKPNSRISGGDPLPCGSKLGGLVYPLPGSKAPVAKCIVESERPGGPIHRI